MIEVFIRIIFYVITLLSLIGCDTAQVFGGVGFEYKDAINKDWDHKNPIGRIGIEGEKHLYKSLYSRGYCEHNSSIPEKDHPGQQICGLDGVIKLK
jgi:hypothetical protein